MKKTGNKKILCAAMAVAMTMCVSGVAFSGCVSVNNEEDVKQVVATVDITKSSGFSDEFGDCASAVSEEVILKRDLIASFLSVGYSWVNNGSSYEETFNMLKDNLVNNAIVTQYATAAVLKDKIDNGKDGVTLDTFKAKAAEGEKAKYEYLLGEEGVNKAKYSLNSTLNSTLDSYEQNYIKEEQDDDEYTGSGSRSTPAGIDGLQEDYVPEDYNVYTGYTGYLLSGAGDDYEPLDNTNRNTRRKAYASFVSYLRNNYLLTEEDQTTTDIWELSYVREAYVDQLKQEVVNEYNELFEEQQKGIIAATENVDGKEIYTYAQGRYEKILAEQQTKYDTSSEFESAMSGLSDTSFILYSPSTEGDTEASAVDNGTLGKYGTFGYVYNILLPFSARQSLRLTELQGKRDADLIDENQYYAERNNLLKAIQTTDQRGAWFNGTKDYSFNVKTYNEENADKQITYYNAGDDTRNWLFFENNLTQSGEGGKYEKLEKYIGKYSYNGSVIENENGSYQLLPNKLSIDGMLEEFSAYVNYVLGDGTPADKVKIYQGDSIKNVEFSTTNADYYGVTDFKKTADEDSEIDYSKFVYATGQVDLTDLSDGTMFYAGDQENKATDRYLAMAAVNELQYAYTTDTGVLSQYIGYSVSAYETSYIKEFEYAAQQALKMGVGAFKVCAGDYGWHLIYVTDVFKTNGEEEYTPVFTEDNVKKEGTFENRFFEWLKDSALTNETTIKRSEIIKKYNNGDTVVAHPEVYKDLTELG